MQHPKQRIFLIFIVLVPIFFMYSLLLSTWRDGRLMDFGIYWQAGHMTLAGQSVYDSGQWEIVRQSEGIVDYPEGIFLYPLPLAVLFSLLALLPLQTAYILWMFLAQIAVLVSILILLSFYSERSGYLELLTIACILFFRPMFSLVNSGQILSFLFLALVISIRLFHNGRWFAGGLILSVLSLKPSIGFPLFVFVTLWLVFEKRWKGIWGMIVGGLGLMLIGVLVNPRWMIDYLNTSDDSFRRFFGMQPTLWGVVERIFQTEKLSFAFGILFSLAVVVVEAYLLWKNRSKVEPFMAFAMIVPSTLMVVPYMWNYDQILLVVPMIFILITISRENGISKAAMFLIGIVALAFAMVAVASWVGHDVWSFMNTLVVWLLSLYFVSRPAGSLEMLPDGRSAQN